MQIGAGARKLPGAHAVFASRPAGGLEVDGAGAADGAKWKIRFLGKYIK